MIPSNIFFKEYNQKHENRSKIFSSLAIHRISPRRKGAKKRKKKKGWSGKGETGNLDEEERLTRARSEDRRVIYLHGGNESSTTCSRKSVRVENLILSLPPPPLPLLGEFDDPRGAGQKRPRGETLRRYTNPFQGF